MKYGVWNRDYDLHKNGVDHLVAKRRLIQPRRQETHTHTRQPSTRRALQIDSPQKKMPCTLPRKKALQSTSFQYGLEGVDFEELHTKRVRRSQSSSKVIRSGGPIRCGRSHRSVCTIPKTRCTSAACGCRSGALRNFILVATGGHGVCARTGDHKGSSEGTVTEAGLSTRSAAV